MSHRATLQDKQQSCGCRSCLLHLAYYILYIYRIHPVCHHVCPTDSLSKQHLSSAAESGDSRSGMLGRKTTCLSPSTFVFWCYHLWKLFIEQNHGDDQPPPTETSVNFPRENRRVL